MERSGLYVQRTRQDSGFVGLYIYFYFGQQNYSHKRRHLIVGTWLFDHTPREGEGPLASGGELYIQLKFSSQVAAFVDISKQWKPYIVGKDATLLTFDHGISLSLVKN
jgi:hypothetical protein